MVPGLRAILFDTYRQNILKTGCFASDDFHSENIEFVNLTILFSTNFWHSISGRIQCSLIGRAPACGAGRCYDPYGNMLGQEDL